MRRATALIGAMALSMMTAGCRDIYDPNGATVIGSGRVVVESRVVRGVVGVTVSGSGTVIVERGGTESLTITAEDNILPYLAVENQGGVVVLGTVGGVSISPTKEIVFRLTVRELDHIAVSGAGEVFVNGIDTPFLDVAISGSGIVEPRGFAVEQRVAISGDGRYFGDDLTSRVAGVEISGSGRAVVRASDLLDAQVSGAGVVEFLGRPWVRQAVSGTGAVVWRGP